MTPHERYANLVAGFTAASEATWEPSDANGRRMFGAGALKIDGRIFAMLTGAHLVVKLPRGRVDALVISGDGERFDPGHGRLMKEWLSLDPRSEVEWEAVAAEALEFVRAKR